MKKIVLALALTVSAAPAAAQSRVELQMAAELRILQEQAQQLALRLEQLAKAIDAVNARIDASEERARKDFADQAERIKNLGVEISVIREGTQGTSTRLGELRDEVEAMRASLTSLPALIAQYSQPPAVVDPADPDAAASAGAAGAPPDGAAPPLPPPVAPPPPVQSTLGLSPTRMYNQALADYQSGQYSLAISGFEAFLRQFPTSEFADDAYVHMGEAYSYERNFEEAIAAYNQAIQNFPAGNTIPLAYYKRGLAYEQLGRSDEARASFEELIKLHPNSVETILAQSRLDALNREQQPPQ